MGLFDGISNVNRLKEKKAKANRIIERADRDFSSAVSSVNQAIRDYNRMAQPLYDRKIQILKRLNMSTKGIREYDVDRIESFDSRYKPEYSSETGEDWKTFFSGVLSGDDGGWMEQANEFIESAEEYRDELYTDINKMNKVKANIDILKQHLYEEEKILSAIEESMNKRRDFKSAEIAKMLQALLAENTSDSQGQLNDKYSQILDSISSIDNAF